MNGNELKLWREQRGLSQRDLAAQLDVSDSAVNRWENGQEIPGPVQMLLRLLIHGEMPFGNGQEDTAAEEAKHFWALKLTLADWHKLEGLAATAGFATVRDYLLHLIREHLEEEAGKNGPCKTIKEGVTIAAQCSGSSLSVPTATSCETGLKAPSLPAKDAPIVELPTAHWSGSAEGSPVVDTARQDVVTPKPKRGRRA